MNVDKWIGVLKPALSKYNVSEHAQTKMSPYKAKQDENWLDVYLQNFNKMRHDRKYPDIRVNDHVRIMVKKDNKTKGYSPKWSLKVYSVIAVSNGEYKLEDGLNIYIRHELLKI